MEQQQIHKRSRRKEQPIDDLPDLEPNDIGEVAMRTVATINEVIED